SVNVLAVSTRDRSAAFPDVPTVAEQGVSGFDLELWFGVFAPKGTTPAVVAKLNEAMTTALRSADGSKAFDDLGFTVDPTSADQLAALVKRESVKWAELARSGVLKMD